MAVVESLVSATSFAKEIIGITEISFAVYSENQRMLNLAKKISAKFVGAKISQHTGDKKLMQYRLTYETIENILEKYQGFYR